ncbi:MAG: DUF2281 domain-containing protein [Acidobacteria bacterium]|jgi:hypothetical protein|nr:DUF2281 domain-containing protein [Acidobacteriota bacterium]
MSSVTPDVVIQKFEIFPDSAKKEVAYFIDFMLQKRVLSRKKCGGKSPNGRRGHPCD